MRVSPTLRIVCVTFSVIFAFSAYSGEISGPFSNRLSPDDVKQIKAAIAKERSVSRNVKKIEAVRPDKVTVQTTARTAVDEDTVYQFKAYKRAGAWAIDTNTIQMSIEKRDLRTNGPVLIR